MFVVVVHSGTLSKCQPVRVQIRPDGTFCVQNVCNVIKISLFSFFFLKIIQSHYLSVNKWESKLGPTNIKFQVYCIFSQVYNSKQHEMHVQNFKYFSMAVTLQLDC